MSKTRVLVICCALIIVCRSLVGITSNGARVDGPGIVTHAGQGEMQIIDMDPEGETHRALSSHPTGVATDVCEVLQNAGFAVNLKPWSTKDRCVCFPEVRSLFVKR